MAGGYRRVSEWESAAIERQKAIQVGPSRDIISALPDDVQQDLRRRAHHAAPRSARLWLDRNQLALYESEIALELAQLYIDLKSP